MAVGDTMVTVDEAMLRRLVAWAMSVAPENIPSALDEAAGPRPGVMLKQGAAVAAIAPPLCLGDLPKCDNPDVQSLGASLSLVCPDAADVPTWERACEVWGVESATALPVLPDLPALVLVGGHNPFAARSAVDAEVSALLPDAFVVEHTASGHNVLGLECAREVRTQWLDDGVTAPPSEPECLSEPLFTIL